ncbi:MAG: phage tail protein [Oscillospiraceae bacterium]|nr:phage tail protein [Oscillospiraceae bacterium]
MAVIGYLGKDAQEGILFTVSEQTVRTLSEWKWSGSARYAVHQRHNTHALTEFTGLEPDKITFDMVLLREMGVDPMEEIKKLWGYERDATAAALTVGDHAYGKYRWNVVSHDVSITHTDIRGNITAATVSVTLQEYLRE